MSERDFDTQLTGQKAFIEAQKIIQNSGHFVQPVDGSIDNSIDGYIRLRKKTRIKKNIKGKIVRGVTRVETGNLIGFQVKGVSKIPTKGSNSYYINVADKTKFGINFQSKEKLDKHKVVWQNFIGPVIIIFVDLESNKCWWGDTQIKESYSENGYSMIIKKENHLNDEAFREIKRLGGEKFISSMVQKIDTKDHNFETPSIVDLKNSAKKIYTKISFGVGNYPLINNNILGDIRYSQSGWQHITRKNRGKMRMINSLILLSVSYMICKEVKNFTKVKKGTPRESKRYIKKIDYLTLRAEVKFNYRQSSIIQVVLRRIKTFDKQNTLHSIPDKVYFHSVYEPFRTE
ncbi:DUF4365 domain-containing protein [Pedobacter sp. MC2016-05]|uniref:DUF4365 domain-containing protein n=1 Tax=Pedobacter sp. MC2016-05 TaxID=2994474 RepID=UPI002247CFA2|nr:DUF4365 domain-containing protein [Pedobacter sp. MC2016-05]MCX2474641.1 DUF4365 domain-containing protein [Pedobacter sp. MC2016-05]